MIGEQTPLSAGEEQLLTGLLREALGEVEPRSAFGPALLERLSRERHGMGVLFTLSHPWIGAVTILFLLVTAGAGYQYFLNPGRMIRTQQPTQAPIELRTTSPERANSSRKQDGGEAGFSLPVGESQPSNAVPSTTPFILPPQQDAGTPDESVPPANQKSLRALPAVGSGSVTGSGSLESSSSSQ